MKILMVASEVAPFAKTGGLADVTAALPRALRKQGHDVRIILPYYRSVEAGDTAIIKGRKSVTIPIDGKLRKGLLRQTSLDDIPVYLVENKEFFSREYLYGTPEGDYPDNPQRFSFFCRAVLELLRRLDFRPDIIHCHDWQTALIPVLLRYELQDDLFYRKTGLIYTIHNLAYQGLFERTALADMGLDERHFTMDQLEYYGKVNLMKGAILTADRITTVSEAYCSEIQTPELGCGLEGVLAGRQGDLQGILNGLDYELWNPATDRHLYKNYTASSLGRKLANKAGLQREMGLTVSPDTPLFGVVTRLAEQKGIDLLLELLPRFAAADLQLVLLGAGEERYLRQLKEFTKLHPANISINLGFEAAVAPRIYAGSDLFLMPSRYEPCGLGQLIALRYGSVPVVRKTGGLADTVLDVRDGWKDPNGFTFDDYTADAFWGAVERSLQAYRDQKAWKALVRHGMTADYSWRNSAGRYEQLYRSALEQKGVKDG